MEKICPYVESAGKECRYSDGSQGTGDSLEFGVQLLRLSCSVDANVGRQRWKEAREFHEI